MRRRPGSRHQRVTTLAADAKPGSFRAVARAACAQRGVSVQYVSAKVAVMWQDRYGTRKGASASSAQKHLAGTATSSPSVTLMELAAEALDLDPASFTEWRLAKAREALDESVVGWDAAVRELRRVQRRSG